MPLLRFTLLALAVAIPLGCNKRGGGIIENSDSGSSSGGASSRDASTDLLTARKSFKTKVSPNANYEAEGPADRPPRGTFDVVKYKSPAGQLVAYVTPDPKDGKKRPAVVWAHGGFGGINGGSFWARPDPANDQTAAAFRDAGCVLMCPSWRGENDNPGQYEMFYGEVEDFLAARDYVASLPYVDANRIYLAGHSTGGTLTLLAATTSDKFRAAFSFGGAPDIGRVVSMGGYGNTPFNARVPEEGFYRSATYFVGAIKRPTFYFEGSSDGPSYCPDAEAMAAKAKQKGVPFKAYTLPWGDHFSILYLTTRVVANKIKADTGPTCNIDFTKQEVRAK